MITVHLGLHKTGSSSIQLHLARQPVRGRRTIEVPRPGHDSTDGGVRGMLARTVGHRGAIVSDENLLGSPLDGYALAEHRIRLIAECLRAESTRIVIVVRPQLPWLASVYTQLVQIGGTATAAEFWAGIRDSPWIHWSTMVEALFEAFGRDAVVVLPYAPDDVVGAFCRVVGIAAPPSGSIPRENVSLTAVQVPLLAAVNRQLDDPRARGRARAAFQLVLTPGAARGMSVFDSGIQREILRTFLPDWQRLRTLVDGEVASGIQAAIDAWPSEPEPYAGASIHDAAIGAEALRALGILTGAQAAPGGAGLGRRLRTALRHPRHATRRLLSRLPG